MIIPNRKRHLNKTKLDQSFILNKLPVFEGRTIALALPDERRILAEI